MSLYCLLRDSVQGEKVTYTGRRSNLYEYVGQSYVRPLLCVGIKVVDEWQKSLDYVRGSNIYVRGYLDLRAWSLRLRA